MPLSSDTPLTDDLVASILQREAARRSAPTDYVSSPWTSSSSTAGRRRPNALKPNTRFLCNMIQGIDSHNTALKAKEEAESHARRHRIRMSDEDAWRQRSRGQYRDRVERHGREDLTSGRRARRSASPAQETSRRDEERPRRKRRRTSEEDNKERERETKRDRTTRDTARQRSPSSNKRDHPSERRPRTHTSPQPEPQSRTRSRSRSPQRRKHRNGDERPSDRRHRRDSHSSSDHSHRRPRHHHHRREPSPHVDERRADLDKDSDSDPLEALVGPLPAPQIRARGRGAHKTSAIDARFASGYDPTLATAVDSNRYNDDEDDDDDDDWDLALEALRDRTRWRKHRAERLRAAGFTEEEVRRFEDGGGGGGGIGGTGNGGGFQPGNSSGGEKDLAEIRWKKRGEGREWDRGKVVGEERVEIVPEWGRLKGT